MSNNPVGIDYWMFKTLMRQTDIPYKTLVVSQSLYLHFSWHFFFFLKEFNVGYICYITLHPLYPPTKCCSTQLASLSSVQSMYWISIVPTVSKVVENQRGKSWPYLRSVLYYTTNSTRWFHQIFFKQKAPLFSPICCILTVLFYSYNTVWKEHIINKNFDHAMYPI